MLSLSHKFLFVHVPKTGGNSIQTILSGYSDDKITRVWPWQDGVEDFGVTSQTYETKKHSTLAEYSRAYGDTLFESLFKFCTVRNPWDRCVSHFTYETRGRAEWSKDPFVKFIRAEVYPLSYFVSMIAGEPLEESLSRLDFIMRFESLKADFNAVCARLEIPNADLPHKNKSAREDYRRYYDDESASLVATQFADEIRYFGYEF